MHFVLWIIFFLLNSISLYLKDLGGRRKILRWPKLHYSGLESERKKIVFYKLIDQGELTVDCFWMCNVGAWHRLLQDHQMPPRPAYAWTFRTNCPPSIKNSNASSLQTVHLSLNCPCLATPTPPPT